MYQYQNGGSTYLSTPIIRNYLYDGTEDNTFGRIKSITYSGFSNKAFSYTYNKFGYIETQSYDGNETSYVYDELGQLIRENNELLGKTYTYEYDSRGNILSKKTYAFTTGEINDDTPTLEADRLYSYASNSWKDQLTGYNGATITYDALGNPLSYNNGTAYTFTWQKGRQLASATVGTNSVSYEYDVNGLRTSKTVNGTVYNYYWQGSLLAAMTVTSGNTTDVLKFYYNASGIPTVFTAANSNYYLRRIMYNIKHFLEKVKNNPALYLGEKNLQSLSFAISGYEEAIFDLTGKRVLFNTKFQRFVEHKYRGEYLLSIHWSKFLSNGRSAEEAFDLFFDIWNEFQQRYPAWEELHWNEFLKFN